MMVDLDLAYLPAEELARLMRAGEVSPVEVMENTLARIAEVNPELNCFCFVFGEEALTAARTAEAELRAGRSRGPLHGVPVAFKDLTPTKGKTTTRGSRVFADWVPDHDAVVVERLAAAGAILVGKTTTPEFAFSGFTASPLWGITRNPWDRAMNPGGSSGGSGVAVATGCVPLAEGTDMGGSVRIPAAECGVVGLKPSLGRIPMDILPSGLDDLSHFGPLTRTVDDAARFLAVAQGPDDRDLSSLPEAPPPELPVPGDVAGLRVALSIDLGCHVVDAEIEANTRAVAAALEEAGAVVDEVDVGWTAELERAWRRMWAVFMAAYFGRYLEEWRERMDPGVVALIEAGNAMSAVDYKRIEVLRTEAWRELARILADHEALLCPTMGLPPVPVEDKGRPGPGIDEQGRSVIRSMTELFNLVGRCPVLSIPSGFTSAGLPTGASICGRRHDEATVLRLGKAVERHRPWSGRRPPV